MQFTIQCNSIQFNSIHIDIKCDQIIFHQFLTHHWDLLTSDTRPGGRALGHHFCFPKDSMSFFGSQLKHWFRLMVNLNVQS